MNQNVLFARFKSFILLFLIFPANIFSQEDTTEVLSANDKGKVVSDSSRHSFYAGTGYGSNMIYLGSTISQNQPFGYASLTYGFKDEFFASASIFHLKEIDPFVAFYNFSLNYSHTFNSWFDLSLGVSGYQTTKSLTDKLFSNFMFGDITLGVDWKLIYSRFSFDGLLSKESQGYLQIKNSRYFQTPQFFNDKIYLSFDPYVNLLFGTLIETDSSPVTSKMVTHPKKRWGSGSANSSAATTSYSNKFGLMEIDFGLPVDINFDFLTLEAEPSFVLPTYTDEYFPGPQGFVFLLSAFFRIW
ncbi:MAG TPA: hypothetical protein PLR88_07915 [Bacteroidales bacterium]|nr:hypothetical protein [Bacteroidales bacterium]